MKSKIIAIVMVLFALSSCQKAFNVSSVRFSNEGGTQKIEVNTYERPGHGAEIAQKEVQGEGLCRRLLTRGDRAGRGNAGLAPGRGAAEDPRRHEGQ